MENTLLRLLQKQALNANPLHRLGRATSGIVLFAKTPQVVLELWGDVPRGDLIGGVRFNSVVDHDQQHWVLLREIHIVLYGKIALAEIAMREGKSGAASSILNGVA